ncbi:MAG: ArsR/SmtB family transcription factor [Thermoplasmatota archaeon]
MAEPNRHAILVALREHPRSVTELVVATGQSQSNASHHLRQLRDCGLVTYERDGRSNLYRIAHPEVAAVLDAIDRAAAAVACTAEACCAPTAEVPA